MSQENFLHLNGILPIYKPSGITSFDVIRRVKRVIGKDAKIGHTGTLDPMAEGVMILLLGRTTRLNFVFEDDDKLYGVKALLGYSSESYDNQEEMIKNEFEKLPTKEEIISAIYKFRGELIQIPPAYSAVKIDGKPAYYWKRKKGVDVKIAPRSVKVASRFFSYKNEEFEFVSSVSKGTYIRSLINDIGEFLGCGAVMSGLVRYRAGKIKYHQCGKLDEDFMQKFIANEVFFAKYEKYTTTAYSLEDISRGVLLDKEKLSYECGESCNGGYPLFIDSKMVAFIEIQENEVKYKRVLVW